MRGGARGIDRLSAPNPRLARFLSPRELSPPRDRPPRSEDLTSPLGCVLACIGGVEQFGVLAGPIIQRSPVRIRFPLLGGCVASR